MTEDATHVKMEEYTTLVSESSVTFLLEVADNNCVFTDVSLPDTSVGTESLTLGDPQARDRFALGLHADWLNRQHRVR